MQLTPHFSLEELTFSSTAVSNGIDNTPTAEVIERLTVLAEGLELLRAVVGYPLHIDSGYRCPTLNRLVRGVWNSAHVTGYAADIKCIPFGTPTQIIKAVVASGLKFDQIIQEGTWIHISFDPTMRQEVLTAIFGPNRTTTYTLGV